MRWLVLSLFGVFYATSLLAASFAVAAPDRWVRTALRMLPFALAMVAPVVVPPSWPGTFDYLGFAVLYVAITGVLLWALDLRKDAA